MEPVDYLRILRDRWLLIAVAVGLALSAAWLTTTTVAPVGQAPPPTYRATALLVHTFSSSSGSFGLETLATITTIEPVAQAVAEDIGYEGDPYVLSSQIGASADTDTGILRISATDPDPRTAERYANGFARGLINYLNNRRTTEATARAETLKRQLDELNNDIARMDRRIGQHPVGSTQREILEAQRNSMIISYGSLSSQYQTALAAQIQEDPLEFIQDAAARPIQASAGFQPPQSRTSRLILGGIVGLLAGAALALVIERMNARIRTKEGAEAHFGLPVLAEIPHVSRRARKSVAILDDPVSPAAEATRLLAAGIEHGPWAGWKQDDGERAQGRSHKVLLVTSPAPSEGKTSLVANLAAAYAEMGKRALILSCDLRHPGDHGFFGVTSRNGSGLSHALRSGDGLAVLSDHVRPTGHHNIEIVPSGPVTDRPGELLSGANMRRALVEARERADVVLIDTPPLLTAGDATHLLPHIDAVLLVARAGRTSTRLAERTSEILRRLEVPVVGVALNGVRDAPMARGYYRYTETRKESIPPLDPWQG